MDDLTHPVLPGRGASDYERYLRTDELLALQKTPEEMIHRDELLFQTVHQSSELWLKLAGAEIEAATALLRDGPDVVGATRLIRRAILAVELITGQLHMLEHMSPWEYQTIRRVLGHGSGFDSPGFVRVHHASPALGEAFAELLQSRGLTVVELYRRGRELEDLYQLAERLIEWDERLILWKFHHFMVVQRIIGGHVIGTQGTPVEVLGKRISQQLFPELWKARDELTALAKQEAPQATKNDEPPIED
jgi:tryptophan 2,3-dioxygenase